MSIIQSKYKEPLSAKISLLTDPVVLAQAWKKTHAYMRRHNWYSDVLELDLSAIDLENRLNELAKNVRSNEFKSDDLRVVPAPKNCKWTFKKICNIDPFWIWVPSGLESKDKKSQQKSDLESKDEKSQQNPVPLRPLAHLPVRDQVLSTAIMLCLANAIETAQGCPELDALEARERGMVSYGNRLHCQWRDSDNGPQTVAEHSWGSAKCYSEYFKHYQAFLSRPIKVCQHKSAELQHDQELYVIQLDLKSFFDMIEISALGPELIRLEQEYNTKYGQSLNEKDEEKTKFWDAAKRVLNWKWSGDDNTRCASLFTTDATIPLGLPQGMVASGFLANAYLHPLDQAIVSDFSKNTVLEVDNTKVLLIDYCRYVDDIRIVVSAKKNDSIKKSIQKAVQETVEQYLEGKLKNHQTQIKATKPLTLNTEKTKIQSYKSMIRHGGISAQMMALNGDLSGTFDLNDLTKTADGLDRILWLSEQLESTDSTEINHPLANIFQPSRDIRDDTIQRFAATRFSKTLREQLAFADVDEPTTNAISLGEKVLTRHHLSHDFEQAARRFIKLWTGNPSLVLLLRCAFDLYPHPKLLEPVKESLLNLLDTLLLERPNNTADTKEIKPLFLQEKKNLAFYVIADLLRAGAVETGYREPDAYTEGSDIQGYRECLGQLAKKMLENQETPWYVQQQAYLFLSVQKDTSTNIDMTKSTEELKSYQKLQHMLRFPDVNKTEVVEYLPLALIAQKIEPNRAKLATWLLKNLDGIEEEVEKKTVRMLISEPQLLLELCRVNKKLKGLLPNCLKQYIEASLHKHSTQALPKKTTLLKALVNRNNPFSNENALLALAHLLLQKYKDEPSLKECLEKGLSPNEITLTQPEASDPWKELAALDTNLWKKDNLKIDEIDKIEKPSTDGDDLYSKPKWVMEDKLWMYGLGRILRSALIGDADFTARQCLFREEVGPYLGLRSTWYQRRFGMNNSPEALLTEGQPVTPWLSGFLTALLQWPGTSITEGVSHEVFKASTPQQLLKIIDDRIKELKNLYGKRSKTPFVVMPISNEQPQLRPMRIAVVQTMRPKLAEFDKKDPLHWTPKEMAAHRRHLAEMCKLTHAQVRAWRSALSKQQPLNEDEPLVDLVLFPELSVHEEHVDFLRRLSDNLKASIFAGLTFVHSDKADGVINQGLWLLRSTHQEDGRRLIYVRQGKKFPMKEEEKLGIKSHRPDITLVEFPLGENKKPIRVATAICFDATDLDLVADLRERSDIFLVAALNKDIDTFDSMVGALKFHMYQPVILANNGEFGGSTAQAPYRGHDRLIAHVHGGNQVAVSVFEIEPWHFKEQVEPTIRKEVKSPPAGFRGRNQ
jgi:hypothetical protein